VDHTVAQRQRRDLRTLPANDTDRAAKHDGF
jgi:hypothetical protein